MLVYYYFFFLSKILDQQSYIDNSSGNKVYVMLCVMLFLPIIRVCTQATYVKLISVSFSSFRFVSFCSFFRFVSFHSIPCLQ